MNLGKGQVEYIARDIRKQLEDIGNEEREALRVAARERFFKSREGRMVQHLRTVFAKEKHCGQVCSEVVSSIEERAMAPLQKPFHYINVDEVSREVVRQSLEVNTGSELVEAVKRVWYRKLTPKVRKRFKLKLS